MNPFPITNVGSVLRASKIARFDPRLPQVYTHSQGDWGIVKGKLPKSLNAKYLTFKALDSKYQVPNFKVADAKVSAVSRMIEMIPYVVPPTQAFMYRHSDSLPNAQLQGQNPINLADLSNEAFRNWLKSIHPNSVKSLMKWKNELGIVIDPNANGRDYSKSHGPVYTKWTNGNTIKVMGRILQQYDANATVGIAGFVAECEVGRGRQTSQHISRSVMEFEVTSLQWDRRGRPVMRVSYIDVINSSLNKSQRRDRGSPIPSSTDPMRRTNLKSDDAFIIGLIDAVNANTLK